ncbi:hypothetical protein [Siminovitchia acidinfaciens]|uniref:hypothetical protein n=1 Tax=Siminovitchia acidinfaciens TaxID=2321395 RepID=UPI0013DF89A8|nr:hypothetical protein [Siminovitchia acidinfaciens]
MEQVEDAVQSSISTSVHSHESFQQIVQSIQQNGATVLKVQEQMNKLIQVVDEIEKSHLDCRFGICGAVERSGNQGVDI